MSAFTIDYFIAKFEAIPGEKWTTGTYVDADGRCCAYGHCGQHRVLGANEETVIVRPPEASALRDLVQRANIPDADGGTLPLMIVDVNDGLCSSRHRYPQTTPKARVLAFLRDVKAKLENPS